jgi:purine-binding chemotaxis protein CheW
MTMDLAFKSSAPTWSASGELEALTFDISGETFALEASIVREILDLQPETAVPGARAFVGAVVNFRGRVIPLADLRFAFGMPLTAPTIDSRIVVVELDIDGTSVLAGLKTDKVNEVKTLVRDNSEAPPRFGMRWRAELIECLIKNGEAVIIFPNLHAIFKSNRPKAGAETENTLQSIV